MQLKDPSVHVASPQQLAAYLLGHNVFALRLWQRLILETPTAAPEAADSVVLAIEEMRQSLSDLADEMPGGVVTLAARNLEVIEQLHWEMIPLPDLARAYRWAFGAQPSPGEQEWPNLRSLLGRAFGAEQPLESWRRLGAAIGEYRVRLDDVDDSTPPPDLSPLCEAAVRIGQSHANVPPLIVALGRLTRLKTHADQRAALTKLLSAKDLEVYDSRSAWVYVMGVLSRRLDWEIRDILRLTSIAPLALEPPWDAATEQRNRWIYEQRRAGTSYAKIKAELQRKPPEEGWQDITSVGGIARAAQRYAEVHGLPLPPPGKPGRPKSHKTPSRRPRP